MHLRAAPAGGVAAIGTDAVGDGDHDRISPSGEREVAQPVDPARGWRLRSSSLGRPRLFRTGPNGTEIRNTRRQSIGASRPPSTRPMNMPLTPTMLLMPSAIPRWLAGNASVRIAAEFASRNAAPTPCTTRKHDQVGGAGAAGEPVDRQHQRGGRVDDEAEVVHPHPAEHVPEPPQAHDQHARVTTRKPRIIHSR